MNQTKILIVPEYETQFGGTVLVADRTVSHKLTELGALPIYALDIRTYQEYAALADGLLLLDGTFFHPFRYGGIVESFKELAGYRQGTGTPLYRRNAFCCLRQTHIHSGGESWLNTL